MCRNSKKPWACFETTGPDKNGRVEFSTSCNRTFIQNLQKMGLAGSTDEETAQLFFLQMRMVPEQEQDIVNPQELPELSSEANQFRRGDLKNI